MSTPGRIGRSSPEFSFHRYRETRLVGAKVLPSYIVCAEGRIYYSVKILFQLCSKKAPLNLVQKPYKGSRHWTGIFVEPYYHSAIEFSTRWMLGILTLPKKTQA
jgi:hypothetical protein